MLAGFAKSSVRFTVRGPKLVAQFFATLPHKAWWPQKFVYFCGENLANRLKSIRMSQRSL